MFEKTFFPIQKSISKTSAKSNIKNVFPISIVFHISQIIVLTAWVEKMIILSLVCIAIHRAGLGIDFLSPVRAEKLPAGLGGPNTDPCAILYIDFIK